MSNINIYKEKTCIELRDGTVLFTENKLEDIEKLLNSNVQFIRVDGTIFNKFELKKARIRKLDAIEDFILSQNKEVQDRLKKIMQEREENGFITNGVEHLKRIYKSRYNEDL